MRYLGLVFVVACGVEGEAPVVADTVTFGVSRIECDRANNVGIELPSGAVFTAMTCDRGLCAPSDYLLKDNTARTSCNGSGEFVVHWSAPATLAD